VYALPPVIWAICDSVCGSGGTGSPSLIVPLAVPSATV
jgi:hypothetical protein